MGNARDPYKIFLTTACCALAVLVVLLAWQNRGLKAELAARAEAPPPGSLARGDRLLPFDVVDASGAKSRVTFEGHPSTVVLVFSSTCGACQKTLPVWNKLIASGVGPGVRIVGLQTDFPRGAGAAAPLPVPDLAFPVYGTAAPQGEPTSKFPFIPGAAVVDATGTVRAVWFGVPSDAAAEELRKALAG